MERAATPATYAENDGYFGMPLKTRLPPPVARFAEIDAVWSVKSREQALSSVE